MSIIALFPPLLAAPVIPSSVIQGFQFVTTINGTPNGAPTGAAYLPLGRMRFGLPLGIQMSGLITTGATGLTYTFGFTALPGPAAPAASPALTTAFNTGVSGTLSPNQTVPFDFVYRLTIDAGTQTLQGYSTGVVAGAKIPATSSGIVTGFNLPAAAFPYSWLPQEASAPFIQNLGPLLYIVPQVTASGTSAGASVTLSRFAVTQ